MCKLPTISLFSLEFCFIWVALTIKVHTLCHCEGTFWKSEMLSKKFSLSSYHCQISCWTISGLPLMEIRWQDFSLKKFHGYKILQWSRNLLTNPDTTSSPSSKSGMSLRKVLATDMRASSGHSLNQSMVQQLTREGNWRRRARKISPMGLGNWKCRNEDKYWRFK